jgi:hypothetical protein
MRACLYLMLAAGADAAVRGLSDHIADEYDVDRQNNRHRVRGESNTQRSLQMYSAFKEAGLANLLETRISNVPPKNGKDDQQKKSNPGASNVYAQANGTNVANGVNYQRNSRTPMLAISTAPAPITASLAPSSVGPVSNGRLNTSGTNSPIGKSTAAGSKSFKSSKGESVKGYSSSSPSYIISGSEGKGLGSTSLKIRISKASKIAKSKMSKLSKSKVKPTKYPKPTFTPGQPTPLPQPSAAPQPSTAPKPSAIPKQPTRPPTPGQCRSTYSNFVLSNVPEAIAVNPKRCCDFVGPTSAIITHAQLDSSTPSSLEPFWNQIFQEIDRVTSQANVCFFMTGYDPTIHSGRNLSEVLISVNQMVSSLRPIPSMMSTDPTTDTRLMSQIREISSNPGLPSIGVFNAGYENIIIEALLSGQNRLPYVGYVSDQEFGSQAATVVRDLLDNVPPKAVCLNARASDGAAGITAQRCQSFYTGLGVVATPSTGYACNSTTSGNEILGLIVNSGLNVVWADRDCCAAAAKASDLAKGLGRLLVTGCMDENPGNIKVDFVTLQPVKLQGYAAATWTTFPVIQQERGRDGRTAQYFPSEKSLVKTVIYNQLNV